MDDKITRAEIYLTLRTYRDIPSKIVDNISRNIEEDLQQEFNSLQMELQRLFDLEITLWLKDQEDKNIKGILELCNMTHCNFNRKYLKGNRR